jgi:HEAT repeat protein
VIEFARLALASTLILERRMTMNFLRNLFKKGEANKEKIKALVSALESGSTTERCRAAEELGEIGDDEAVEPLLDLLRSERDMKVREKAVDAWLKIQYPKVKWTRFVLVPLLSITPDLSAGVLSRFLDAIDEEASAKRLRNIVVQEQPGLYSEVNFIMRCDNRDFNTLDRIADRAGGKIKRL